MLADLRTALRSLLRTPGFAAIAIVTLALCIGANSAIFSVVHAILLKPYPWPESDRLVYVYNTYPLMGLANAGVSIPDYLDRRTAVNGFADAAIFTSQSFNLGASTPQRVAGLRATPSLFSTLRTGAALGRVFTDDEAQPGREKVVVLSHGLWKRRFGADPSIVGRAILLNAESYTVVGVMPEQFYFPSPRVQVWVPFAFTPAQRSDEERGTEFSTMIARRRPGATAAGIQDALDAIQARNAERLPKEREFWRTSGFRGRTAGFLEQNVANVRSMLWLVQAGVAAALLIGCANVASLVLTRAVGRERELAIRAALGAGRARLVRLLLVETVLLFSAGGFLGLLVATWGVAALNGLGLSSLPRAFGVQLDLSVLAFTFLCALATGVFFGALAAWSASRGNAAASLKEAGIRATAGRRTQGLRALLVITEMALAVMLLATAGLLTRSFLRVQEVPPGFVAENVFTAQLSLAEPSYADPGKRVAFHDQVLARVRALPAVASVAITSDAPFSGSDHQSSYKIDGYAPPPGQPEPWGERRSVSPDYFRTLGIPLLQGRCFTTQDNASAPGVVIIDRRLADRYWPGGDPLGHKILGGDGPGDKPWTIVGVVATVRNASLEDPETRETLYFPYAQSPPRSITLVVKTVTAPAALLAPVRAAVAAVDAEQPLYDIKTMTARIDDSLLARRAPTVLLSLFSGVALLLATLGVYGVLAFFVTQRRPEFGVRLALGATGRDIAALVLRQGIRLVAVGVVAGLGGYLALSRLIGRLVNGVAPTDPMTLVMAPAILTAAAMTACLLPARKATRVDPIIALRSE